MSEQSTNGQQLSTSQNGSTAAGNILLDVRNLQKWFPITAGFFRRTIGHVKAVDDISFHVLQGETVGLVGESGCGKTTAGRCILRAYDLTGGQVLFQDHDGKMVDLGPLTNNEMKPYRQHVRMIFQD
ncbi:MAG: ATP-binding cassette domain-containing protein, partial [Caldilineaceae bacterium SB0675_bin_29]|nr:ATP-binding cassette domain-containing protein [Caldilineaceae bacterium SB0675_bin_29]